MDPIQIIVSAVAAGAAAGLKPTAAQAVKDAYAAVKDFITRKYGPVDVGAVERKPESESKRASLAEDLSDAGAAADPGLLELAGRLLDALESHDAAGARSVGVDVKAVKAAYLKVDGVLVEGGGTGVRAHDSEFTGGIDVRQVTVGREGNEQDP